MIFSNDFYNGFFGIFRRMIPSAYGFGEGVAILTLTLLLGSLIIGLFVLAS